MNRTSAFHHQHVARLAGLGLVACAASFASATEVPEWTTLGERAGFAVGTIKDVVEWDDGTGPALYLAGDFFMVGTAIGTGVVKFDGTGFTPLGCGILGLDPNGASNVQGNVSYYGEVESLCVWDPDGPGPQASVLVAAGRFGSAGGQTVNNVAVWNGSQWSAMGSLAADSPSASVWSRVHDLAVFGGDLYACGVFNVPGGDGLARWDGASWVNPAPSTPIPSGTWLQGMGVHDDGGGDALYVCGRDIGTVYKLSGGMLSALGTMPASDLRAIASFDPDGDGPAGALLCVAGQTTGGLPLNRAIELWTWNGASWTRRDVALVDDPNTQVHYRQITGMTVYDDGGGDALYMSVGNWEIGPSMHDRDYYFLHKWDGSTFSPVGTPMTFGAGETIWGGVCTPPVVSVVGGGAEVWFASHLGQFDESFGFLSRFDGTQTGTSIPTQTDLTVGPDVFVRDAAMMDPDGAGPIPARLYCVGDFGPGVGAAYFDGQQFHALPPLPESASGDVHQDINGPRCVVFDDGTGPAFYVSLTDTAGTSVYKLTGSSWTPLGAPGDFYSFRSDIGKRNDRINDLIGFDDGTGPKLYATGRFVTVGGVACNHIARWNGTAWEPVGPTVPSVGLFQNVNQIYTSENVGRMMVVHDDGGGPALYVSGMLDGAAGVSAKRIVRWNGTAWQGVGNAFDTEIYAPRIVTHGSEPTAELFAGGLDLFGSSSTLVRWTGTGWADASAGLTQYQNSLELMGSFDVGCGDQKLLGIGTELDYFNDPLFLSFATQSFYEWDGAAWQRVPNTNSWYELAFGPLAFGFDIAGQKGLMCSGILTGVDGNPSSCGTTGGKASLYTAIWGCPAASVPCPGDFNDDGVVDLADLLDFLGAWNPSLGQSVTPGTGGDINGDGVVDLADLLDFLGEWNPNLGQACQ